MSLNLMVGVPSHSGTMVIEGVSTLIRAQGLVLGRGGTFQFSSFTGATISLVRNAIAARFLASDAELLLMLDADQGIESSAIQRMIDFNKPMVGCMYPKRRFDFSNVGPVATTADPDTIAAQALQFVGSLERNEVGRAPVLNGFARAEFVGTGTLLIRREAFLRLMDHFPELEGRGFGPDAYPGLSSNWGFFNPIDNDDGVPLSEDISFCRRWRETGGEIWADVIGVATHVGAHSFSGSYVGHLEASGIA